jgi:hypothetical protein
MQVYVPKPLVALYTLLWRCFVTYGTVLVGSAVFYSWVRRGLRSLETEAAPVPMPAGIAAP